MAVQTSAFRVLDHLLGTHTKVAVLRFLCRNRKAFSGREVARRVGRNAAHVHSTLQELVDAGVVAAERVGRMRLFSIVEGNSWVQQVLVAMFEGEVEVKERLWRQLASAAGGDLVSMVLFGSRARGDSQPGSDLDVFVVMKKGGSADRVRDAALVAGSAYGLSIQTICVTLNALPAWTRRAADLWRHITGEGIVIEGLDLNELKRYARKKPPVSR